MLVQLGWYSTHHKASHFLRSSVLCVEVENGPFFSRLTSFPTFSPQYFIFCIFMSIKFSRFLFQCLTPSIALSVLEDDEKAYLTEEDYQRISTVLLYYILNLQDLCVSKAASPSSLCSPSSGNYRFYLFALTNLNPSEDNQFLSLRETESILQFINQHYDPPNIDTLSDFQVSDFYLGNLSRIIKWNHRYNCFVFDTTVH